MVKIVYSITDLTKEVKTMKTGEEVLLYERPIRNQKERLDFQKYLHQLILMSRPGAIEITGAISFKKTWEDKQ